MDGTGDPEKRGEDPSFPERFFASAKRIRDDLVLAALYSGKADLSSCVAERERKQRPSRVRVPRFIRNGS